MRSSQLNIESQSWNHPLDVMNCFALEFLLYQQIESSIPRKISNSSQSNTPRPDGPRGERDTRARCIISFHFICILIERILQICILHLQGTTNFTHICILQPLPPDLHPRYPKGESSIVPMSLCPVGIGSLTLRTDTSFTPAP
jgi:hypothetical protein